MNKDCTTFDRLTLRALCMYEQYTGNNALNINALSYDDTVNLLYCMFCAQRGMTDRAVFDSILENESLSNDLFADFGKAMDALKIESLFNVRADQKEGDDNPSDPICATRLVSLLVISCRLDPTYVLDEMHLWEAQMYLDGMHEEMKLRLNEGRMWAFIGVSPHISKDNNMTPQKLLPFPWDKEGESGDYVDRNYDLIKNILDKYGA